MNPIAQPSIQVQPRSLRARLHLAAATLMSAICCTVLIWDVIGHEAASAAAREQARQTWSSDHQADIAEYADNFTGGDTTGSAALKT
jgi:hypothetical protein